jgi:HTH-like domain
VQGEIRRLVVQMAIDNPSWGYTRIQGALKNLGHRVARATVARILKKQGISPSRERPMQRRTSLHARWRALLAPDFFTTEVWTVRGLVTYYTLFVIELHTRRVHVLGSTPHPDEEFVIQTMRQDRARLSGSRDAVDGMRRRIQIRRSGLRPRYDRARRRHCACGRSRCVCTPPAVGGVG